MRPLLRRRDPDLRESLLANFVQIRQLNYLPSINPLMYFCYAEMRKLGIQDSIANPRHEETYRFLGTLFRQDPVALYQSTFHRFTSTVTPPQILEIDLKNPQHHLLVVDPYIARRHFRSIRNIGYCVDCLKNGICHRHEWYSKHWYLCFEHNSLLKSQCEGCGHSLTIDMLLQDSCEVCSFKLSTAEANYLKSSHIALEFQQLIETCLYGHNWLAFNDYPSNKPQILYHLLDGLSSAIGNRKVQTSSFFEDLLDSKGTDLKPLARDLMAYTAIRNWPYSFYEYLNHFREISPANKNGAYEELGGLFSRWLRTTWKHEKFQFVQEAFDVYYFEHFGILPGAQKSQQYKQNPLKSPKLLTINAAARLVKASPKTIEKLIAQGEIDVVANLHEKFNFVPASQIEALNRSWEQCLSTEQLVERFGFSKIVISDLRESGILKPLRGPDLDFYQTWLYEKSSVEDFHKSIIAVTQAKSAKSEYIGLVSATQILSVLGLKMVDLIKAVLSRQIAAYLGTSAKLMDLAFLEDDVRNLLQETKSQKGWLNFSELRAYLGENQFKLDFWIAEEYLESVASYAGANYFAKADVDRLNAEFLSSSEAAYILEIGVTVVQTWVRRQRLKAKSGPQIDDRSQYLFESHLVNRYRPKFRRTAPQMAHELCISHTQLIDLIKQGKVLPVSGLGIDQFNQYLFLIDENNEDKDLA
jgi:hypothetical protein